MLSLVKAHTYQKKSRGPNKRFSWSPFFASSRNYPNLWKIFSLKQNYSLLLSVIFLVCISFGLKAQTIYTVAGNGTGAFSGDGGAATLAQVNDPHGIATDAAGNIYISDFENHRIRKINTAGVISTIAGTGFGGYLASQDGGPATAAWIKWPIGVAVDAAGNVYFSDYGNNIIRKINTSGNISTIAGLPGTIPSYGGDGGPATAANLGNAWGVAVDGVGNVLVADALNHRVRKVNVTTGIITTIAGMGFAGFTGDGGPATSASCRLNEPTGVALDAAGNIYIADNANNRVRKINTSGTISTIAGIGLPYGYTGDGGPATLAKLYYPKGIAVDGPGNVYICDWNNNVIRKIDLSGNINTLAGTGVAGFAGDGGPALSSQLNQMTGVAVRSDGDLFIADNLNNRIRRVKIGNDPYFTWGLSKMLLFCPTEFVNIDSVIKVDDIDLGQTLTWTPVMLPSHGTLVVTCTATSTGSTVTPTGSSYIPSVGYVGFDTFTVRVNDGTYSDTITIYVNIPGTPNAGAVLGPVAICPGETVSCTDTIAGGTWSSSTPSVASISSTGAVTGIVAGTTTITYTVTNLCGTAYATRVVMVSGAVPCNVAVPAQPTPVVEQISVLPNPGNGSFTITVQSPRKGTTDVEIYNLIGVKVGHFSIDLNRPNNIFVDQPTGIYFMSIRSGNKKQILKIGISR
jgi:sugar lactone lactonase YvrE